jgi:hypothetical protein
VDGKVADAVLGRFQKDKEQFVAVLDGLGIHAICTALTASSEGFQGAKETLN